MKDFAKKYWIELMLVGVVIILAIAIYLKRRRKESGFNVEEWREMPGACVDCGPGGMFGPDWTMEKFQNNVNELKKRAVELGGGLKGVELEQAIKRAGGLMPYIEGREKNIQRIEEAANNLKDVMNIPGVHGLGSMMNGNIEIAVIDEATKQKVLKFIEEKKKAILMIPGHGEGKYMGHPVKIVIREVAKAQKNG